MNHFIEIEEAIQELRLGNMIILVDAEDREQEGDLVMSAEYITPDVLNFMITYARGFICLTLAEEIVERLELPLITERNKQPNQAAFTYSIEAARGVSSGVSVYDRAETIRVAINPLSTPNDISTPGHVFPLRARKGGVLERPGHTEGSVDLMKLAGLQPAAVICEVMRTDGHMARLPDLIEFAKVHKIKMVRIDDLIHFVKNKEKTCHHLM